VFRLFRVLALAAVTVTAGCAGGVSHWIVNTRVHQGDVALAHGSYPEASNAYKLALQVDPGDTHARAGLSSVQVLLAAREYREAKYDDALQALAVAAKYDPQSVRVAQLRGDIEQARIKREIVLSNYPTYKETARQIRRSYQSLKLVDQRIVSALQRFDYTYDTQELSRAIALSYDLAAEMGRTTNRLVAYRQVVDSGSAETATTPRAAAPASLLPLP
jgi:tetratricopeptide (TPR) repeat protein